MIRDRRLPPRTSPRPDVLGRDRAEDLHTARDMSAAADITRRLGCTRFGPSWTDAAVVTGATRVGPFPRSETAYALVAE